MGSLAELRYQRKESENMMINQEKLLNAKKIQFKNMTKNPQEFVGPTKISNIHGIGISNGGRI